MPYSSVVISLGVAFALCVVIGVRAWRQRQTAGRLAMLMAAMAVGLGVWLAFSILEISAAEWTVKFIAYRAKYLGVVSVPVIWLLFSMQYTGREIWT